jgi:tetratricopeptide (TPR) repeat protein
VNKTPPLVGGNSGFELLNKKCPSEALDVFQKLEKSFPDNIEIIKGLALSHYYLKSYDKAIRYLEKYIRVLPDDSKYLRILANAQMLSKNYHKAKDVFFRLLLINKNEREINSTIRKVLFCIKKEFGATKPDERIYEELLRLCPDNHRVLSILAKHLFESEDYPGAYALSKRLVSLKPDNPVYANLHYRNSYAIHEYDEAFQTIQPFTIKYPKDYRNFYYLGMCTFALERYSEAIDYFVSAQELYPSKNSQGNWFSLFNIGACYLKLGENREAEKRFLESIRLRPNNASYYSLGNIYYSEGNYAQAKETFSKILNRSDTEEVNKGSQPAELVPALNLTRDVEVKIKRLVRDSPKVRELKKMYNNQCQICGTTIAIGKETYYSEVHHIRPLSKAHNGPDNHENMIVLCPNHHTAFDNGCIGISRKTKEVFQFTGKGVEKIGILALRQGHTLSEECLKYYQENIFLGRLIKV